MPESSTPIRVGDWTVEPARNLLQRDGRSIKLDPLTMDVLVQLAERAGEVVPVNELIETVWNGQARDDTQVYKTIAKLRKAFGDDRDDSRYVETIPKRGYRLVAPVKRVEPAVAGPEDPSIPRALGYGLATAGIVGIALLVIFFRPIAEEQSGNPFSWASQSPGYAAYLQAISTTTCCPVIEHLDEAIALDPEFALAYATKAYSIAYRTGWDDPKEREQLVFESADRALELDPTLGLAHAARAFVHMTSLDWEQAERAFEQAKRWGQDEPGVWLLNGRFNRYRHHGDEAVRSGERAVELDSTSHVAHFHLGTSYLQTGDFDRGAAALSRAIGLNPAMVNARFRLAEAEIARGNNHAALRQLRLCEQFFNASEFYDGDDDWRVAQLAYAYARLDLQEDAQRIVTKLETKDTLQPTSSVLLHLAKGDQHQALVWLKKAVSETPSEVIALGAIKANAYSDPVLDGPEFAALRDQISAF